MPILILPIYLVYTMLLNDKLSVLSGPLHRWELTVYMKAQGSTTFWKFWLVTVIQKSSWSDFVLLKSSTLSNLCTWDCSMLTPVYLLQYLFSWAAIYQQELFHNAFSSYYSYFLLYLCLQSQKPMHPDTEILLRQTYFKYICAFSISSNSIFWCKVSRLFLEQQLANQ